MYLPIVATVLGLWSVGGLASDFTINSIELKALPSTKLTNGDTLELKCVVMFAKTTDFVLNSTITFYMDEKVIYTTSSTNDQVSYIIQKARVSNTGNYKCKVSVDSRVKASDDIKIEVTGLSSPLLNVSKDEVSEGDEVTVRCEAPEETGSMVFKFYKISQKGEEEKKKLTDRNHKEVNFLIKEGEEILTFKCKVKLIMKNEMFSESLSKTVTVIAQFSIPRIEVLPSLNFTEGKNMSVKCSVQIGRNRSDDMKLTLQKDGHIIHSSTTNSLSYFQVATVDDRGNYTCKAENTKTSKSHSAKIDIAELFPRPQLTLKRGSDSLYINEQEFITLKCSVAGLTAEASRNLEYKFKVGARTNARKGGNLGLTAMERLSGSYVCEVTISNITKISEPLDIQIYAPVKNPVLTHIMRDNKTVVLGDALELTCKCESGTPPITYTLRRGKEVLEKKVVNDTTEARFRVNSSKSDDLGQYMCEASNRNTEKRGRYSNMVNVTVIIPISSVDLTMIPPNGNVEEGSQLSLICTVKEGTLPITYQFYRKKGSDILLKNETNTNKLHTIYEVKTFSKQEDGAYFCVASNRAHKEVRSSPIEARAVLAKWKKAVIGMFVCLIIVAAIAICVYLHMDKKKKGTNISSEKSRSSKPVTKKNEKPAEEMKSGETHISSVQNEYELHLLKPAEDGTGNTQQNHEVEQTEADGASPDAHPDAAENNVKRVEDAPEANNHT
ncbi:platelet endothelial cell adhesion molecule [Leptodactylus fuscus]|uniref:platelet endothelial cell adhesion molecule n=1 Tax=Leptodactylus fuscus TaxID=238119 RepID=UPI003F4E8938